MKIAVLGAGAMGSLFGGRLSVHNEVFLVDIWKDHVDAINREGLKIEKDGQVAVTHPKAVTDAAAAGMADIVVVFVKSIHTSSALESASSLIGPETVLLSLQNGLGNTDDMLAFADKDRVLAGTTNQGCTLRGPGHVAPVGHGATYIGAMGPSQGRAEMMAKLLNAAGFETYVAPGDVMNLIWSKLFINVGINAICATLGVTSGYIYRNPDACALADAAVREAVAVANAAGMAFDADAVMKSMLDVSRKTDENRCSMLADVSAGRRTEIERINGAVVRVAKQHHMEAPYNQALTLLIKAKEATYMG